MTDKEIDEIISQMCCNRKNNPDVVLIDDIQNNYTPNHDEIISDHTISKSIEDEIIKKIFESTNDKSDIDNMIKTNPKLYNKYVAYMNNKNIQSNAEMDSIINEIKLQLSEEKKENGEVENTQSRFQKDDIKILDYTIDKSARINDNNTDKIINDVKEEGVNMNDKNLETSLSTITDTNVTDNIIDEEFPITTFDIDEKLITSKINKLYKNINEADIYDLISIMTRFKNKEKFNVYEALPNIFKSEIFKAASELGGIDKSTLNFLAKNFINEIIEDSIMSDEIEKFNSELKSISESVNNVPGLIVDGYNDEIKSKFEDTLNEAYDNIKESDPDKAKRILKIKKSFIDSYTLERIFSLIEKSPSLINRAYKTARDKFNSVIAESESKFGANSKFNNVSDKNIPKIKTIDCVNNILKEKYKNASTMSVLIHNSMISAIENSDEIDAYIYCYYIVSGIMSIRFTSNNSDYINKLNDNLSKLNSKISDYMNSISSNKKKSRKRGR